MVFILPFLGLLPVYYHDFFTCKILKIVVENGNKWKNLVEKGRHFMVEKNGNVFYFSLWNIEKW